MDSCRDAAGDDVLGAGAGAVEVVAAAADVDAPRVAAGPAVPCTWGAELFVLLKNQSPPVDGRLSTYSIVFSVCRALAKKPVGTGASATPFD